MSDLDAPPTEESIDPDILFALEPKIELIAARPLFAGWPASTTMWRWVAIGYHGIKLQSQREGRRIFTSKGAVERFIAATTAASAERFAAKREQKIVTPVQPHPRPEGRRAREIAGAARRLERAGV